MATVDICKLVVVHRRFYVSFLRLVCASRFYDLERTGIRMLTRLTKTRIEKRRVRSCWEQDASLSPFLRGDFSRSFY